METAEQILARELRVAVAWLRAESRFRAEEGKTFVSDQMTKQADHWEMVLSSTGVIGGVDLNGNS